MLTRSRIFFLSVAGATAIVCANVSCGGGGGGFGDGGAGAGGSSSGGASAGSGGAGGSFAGSGGSGGSFAGSGGAGGTGGSFAGSGGAGGSVAAGSGGSGGVAAAGSGGAGGAGGTGGTGATSTCAATVAAGAITTTAGMAGAGGFQSMLGTGYTFAFTTDAATCAAATGGLSTFCIDPENICVAGTTGVGPPMYVCNGAGFGLNIGQTMGSSATGMMAAPAGSTGITYALSNLPTITGGGMRIQVTTVSGGATPYCSPITAASGSVTWASFIQMCYNPAATQGPALPAAGPSDIQNVGFTIDDGSAAGTYNLCLTGISFTM